MAVQDVDMDQVIADCYARIDALIAECRRLRGDEVPEAPPPRPRRTVRRARRAAPAAPLPEARPRSRPEVGPINPHVIGGVSGAPAFRAADAGGHCGGVKHAA